MNTQAIWYSEPGPTREFTSLAFRLTNRGIASPVTEPTFRPGLSSAEAAIAQASVIAAKIPQLMGAFVILTRIW